MNNIKDDAYSHNMINKEDNSASLKLDEQKDIATKYNSYIQDYKFGNQNKKDIDNK